MATLAQILSRSTARVPKRFAPLLTQAYNEALVRYGGPFADLDRVRERESMSFRQQRDQANSAAQLQAALAQRTLQQIDSGDNPLVRQLTGYENTPPGSSASVVARNLALSHDATRGLLATAASNAPIQAAQQIRGFESQHLQNLGELEAKRAGTLGEVGNYVTGRYESLVGDDRKRRSAVNKDIRNITTRIKLADKTAETARRGQDLSHEDRVASIDQRRDAAAQRARDKKNPAAKSPFLPPVSQTRTVGRVKGAQAGIKQLAGRKSQKTGRPISKDQIETLLRSGQIDGVKYSQPEIDVAMDLYHNQGKLSDRGVRVLHGTLRTQVKGNFGVAPRRLRRRPKVGPPVPAGPAGPV